MKHWPFVLSLSLLPGIVAFPVEALENDPLHGLHQDIQSEMEEEAPVILPHVEVLWRHTVMRNPTLQLALQKMAEKTGKLKPQDKTKWTKGMLQNLINIGGMGGSIMVGNPAPMVGSVVLSRATAQPQAAKQLTAVTSADLVILAREIEQAQTQVLLSYLQYRQALETQMKMQNGLNQLQNQARSLPQDSPEINETLTTLITAQTLKLQDAREHVETQRNLLVLLAGNEALDGLSQVLEQQRQTKTPEVPENEQTTPPPEEPAG